MPFLLTALIVFPLFYFTAGRNFYRLWKGGLIGTGIMMAVDYAGFRMNLYDYHNGIIMLGGFMPLLHTLNIFIISMMYVNWLPRGWSIRLLYNVYLSVIFLALEASIYKAGSIVYHNWKLGYSFLLIIGGLYLLAYLSDFVTTNKTAA